MGRVYKLSFVLRKEDKLKLYYADYSGKYLEPRRLEQLNGEIRGLNPAFKAVVSRRLELRRQICVQKIGGRRPLGNLGFRRAGRRLKDRR
jgi:hypothetical protein